VQSTTPNANQSDNQSTPNTSSERTYPSSTSERKNGSLKVVSLLFRAGIVIGILIIAFGIVRVLDASKVVPARTEELRSNIQVRTIEAQRLQIDRTWDGYGTARSMNDADVVAEVGGRVIERPQSIEPGVRVEVGTVLLRLDSGDYSNALDAANQAASAIEAQIDGLSVESERVGTQIELASDEIESAQRDLDRTRQAVEAGAGSAGELDTKTAALRRVQREVESLRQNLEMIPSRRAQLIAQLAAQRSNAATAQENLERSVIRSPIAGVIQSVSARRGDWVGLGTPIARVVDLSLLEIPVKLPASAINWLDLGQQVQLWEGEPIGEADNTGIITRIAPEADSSSRTVTVYVEVEQNTSDKNKLNPGRFILARVSTPDDQPRFVVPRRAIQNGRLLLATPAENGQARIDVVPITTDYSIDGTIESMNPDEDQWTVIASGLQEGQLVVVTLLDQLTQGMLVDLVGESTAASNQHNTQSEDLP
jgi:RND family efflux transporter MFP subunit